MIWTLAMVQDVERLGMAIQLDKGLLHRYPEAKERTQQEMTRKLVRLAHPFGVEINPADVAFHESEEPFGLKIYAQWRPATTLVEFRGGHIDGQRMTVTPELIRKPIRIPRLESNLFRPEEEALLPGTMSEPLQYDLAGWHEEERHWIYDATPTRHLPPHP